MLKTTDIKRLLVIGMGIGVIALLLVTLLETVTEMTRPVPVPEPDILDEVEIWRLHREAREILRKADEERGQQS